MHRFIRVGLELPAPPPRVVAGGWVDRRGDWPDAAHRAGPRCEPCTLAGDPAEAPPSAVRGVVVVVGTGRDPGVVARQVSTPTAALREPAAEPVR